MGILDFFKTRRTNEVPRYENSSHHELYEKIAGELNTEPQHVYELAHGKGITCFDDKVIVERLYQSGLFSENKSGSHH